MVFKAAPYWMPRASHRVGQRLSSTRGGVISKMTAAAPFKVRVRFRFRVEVRVRAGVRVYSFPQEGGVI